MNLWRAGPVGVSAAWGRACAPNRTETPPPRRLSKARARNKLAGFQPNSTPLRPRCQAGDIKVLKRYRQVLRLDSPEGLRRMPDGHASGLRELHENVFDAFLT